MVELPTSLVFSLDWTLLIRALALYSAFCGPPIIVFLELINRFWRLSFWSFVKIMLLLCWRKVFTFWFVFLGELIFELVRIDLVSEFTFESLFFSCFFSSCVLFKYFFKFRVLTIWFFFYSLFGVLVTPNSL